MSNHATPSLLAGPSRRALPVNTQGRDFFVGDLHGQLTMLQRLLNHVDFDADRDRLIAVGDLLDRGPDCVPLLRLLEAGALHSVMGNHESIFIAQRLLMLEHPDRWYGADDWVSALTGEDIQRYCDLLSQLPLSLEVPLPDGRCIGVVHAEVYRADWKGLNDVGLLRTEALGEHHRGTSASEALWGRDRAHSLREGYAPFGPTHIQGVTLVVSGHSALTPAAPWRYGNQISLESLAFHPKGAMTLYEPLSDQYWRLWNPHQAPDATVESIPPPIDLALAQAQPLRFETD